jgi:hypothetical protein
MKALIAEVFTRFGARKGKPLEPGWITPTFKKPNPDPESGGATAARFKAATPADTAAKSLSALPPLTKLGTLASPDYVNALNQRIERFRERVAALERFKESGKDNVNKQPKR